MLYFKAMLKKTLINSQGEAFGLINSISILNIKLNIFHNLHIPVIKTVFGTV